MAKNPIINTPFPTALNARYRPKEGITFSDESRTQGEFAEECDINRIMARYTRTGVLPSTRSGGTYGDFTGVTDFLDAQNRVLNAQREFDALPSNIRERFRNSPAVLIEFLQDESNRPEAEKLGLVNKKPAPAPAEVPAANITNKNEK